jgi:hypothetical protein
MRAPRGIGQRYLDRLDRVEKGSRRVFSPPCVQPTTRYRPVLECYMNEWLRTAMVFLQRDQSRNFG